MYDINGKSKQLLKGIEMSKQHMFFNNGNLFVKGKVGSFYGFGGTNKIVKLDTKNGKVVELLSEENQSDEKIEKNSKYLTILREKSGFPVYTLNIGEGTFKKVCERCGRTERESHVFKSDDVFYYGYSIYQVGKFLYYGESKSFATTDKYYRVNILTGEKIERFKNN